LKASVNSGGGKMYNKPQSGHGTSTFYSCCKPRAGFQVNALSGICQYMTRDNAKWRADKGAVTLQVKIPKIGASSLLIILPCKIQFYLGTLNI